MHIFLSSVILIVIEKLKLEIGWVVFSFVDSWILFTFRIQLLGSMLFIKLWLFQNYLYQCFSGSDFSVEAWKDKMAVSVHDY